jgi:hypothetical protein
MEALLSRTCLNYAASADSSSSSGKHFSDFHCLEKGPHWTKLILVSSRFFTIGFSVGTKKLNHDASSPCLPICASTCAKIFILSLTVSDLGFHLLYIFHPFVMKFILVCNKIWFL